MDTQSLCLPFLIRAMQVQHFYTARLAYMAPCQHPWYSTPLVLFRGGVRQNSSHARTHAQTCMRTHAHTPVRPPCSHVRDEECDEVRGYKIKYGVLGVHLGHQVPLAEIQDVTGGYYLIKGILKKIQRK